MKKFTNLMFVPMAFAATLAASACDSADSGGDDDGGDGGGGTAGAAGTGGTGATDASGTVLVPSADGWMDRMDVWNDLGIQGSWYPYGDQYGTGEGDAKCT